MMKILLQILIILMLAFCSCKSDQSYTVIINDVNGLELGSQVVFQGLPIGRISDMDLFNDSVAVDIILEKNIRIPLYSTFIVETGIFERGKLVLEKSDFKTFATVKDSFRGSRFVDTTYRSATDSVKRRKKQRAIQKINEGILELLEPSKRDSN